MGDVPMQDVAPDGEAAMDVDEALDAKMGEEPTPMVDTLCVCVSHLC